MNNFFVTQYNFKYINEVMFMHWYFYPYLDDNTVAIWRVKSFHNQ